MPNKSKSQLDDRLLSREGCGHLFQGILSNTEGGGETRISLTGFWNGGLRWARNRVSMSSDIRNIELFIQRKVKDGSVADITINQLDDESVKNALRFTEIKSRSVRPFFPEAFAISPAELKMPKVRIWSEAVLTTMVEERSKLVQSLAENSVSKSMLSAGYFEVRAAEFASMKSSDTELQYKIMSQCQCSVTVRHPQGKGSGWAGQSSFDFNTIDAGYLSELALSKCLQSLDPVRVEPGRYTVVLEPQAVFEVVHRIDFSRTLPELSSGGPFFLGIDEGLGIGRSKLGLKVVDERVTIHHDPEQLQTGVIPYSGLESVTLIKKGVLTNLIQGVDPRKKYTLPQLNDNIPVLARPSLVMEGGEATLSKMIHETERGLLVSKFSNVRVLDVNSVLTTGITRDGLWLIEKGKITKAVHNMRFTESPLFILNRLVDIGPTELIFRPVDDLDQFSISPYMFPPIRANDFSFTSLIDAI